LSTAPKTRDNTDKNSKTENGSISRGLTVTNHQRWSHWSAENIYS